jgi:hypothetical protein
MYFVVPWTLTRRKLCHMNGLTTGTMVVDNGTGSTVSFLRRQECACSMRIPPAHWIRLESCAQILLAYPCTGPVSSDERVDESRLQACALRKRPRYEQSTRTPASSSAADTNILDFNYCTVHPLCRLVYLICFHFSHINCLSMERPYRTRGRATLRFSAPAWLAFE